jgi:hypothetical protein
VEGSADIDALMGSLTFFGTAMKIRLRKEDLNVISLLDEDDSGMNRAMTCRQRMLACLINSEAEEESSSTSTGHRVPDDADHKQR